VSATLIQAAILPPEWSAKGDWQKREEDYIEKLKRLVRVNNKGDLVGEVVRWQRADGYASYMVATESPLRLIHLDLGDGYRVETSLLRGLTLGEVRLMVAAERGWRNLIDDSNAIYATLKPGEIVHYNDGFAQFVRCEVVAVPHGWTSKLGSKPTGNVVLKPIALVGEVGRRQNPDGSWVHGWSEYDLYRRAPDGTVSHGYHAEQIINGELFQPNGANLYESPRYSNRSGIDPRELKPISLNPPAMSTAEERAMPLAKAINRIRQTLEDIRSYDEATLRGVLEVIHKESDL
jgi:hypothetical protein